MEKFLYEDILNVEAPKIKTREPMPIKDRAAQFSSFAAVVGHSAAIEETARITDSKKELDEYRIKELNEKLRYCVNSKKEVIITYFSSDQKKHGGAYLNKTGIISRLSEVDRQIVIDNNTVINIDDIVDIDV